jgi:alanyl-tRNA synthetase
LKSAKEVLREKFSTDHEKYYSVELFQREGFSRRRCTSCGKFYWTADAERTVCPEQPCQQYEFIGDPPTSKRYDYIETWKEVEKFFKSRGHTSVASYPVVARWRPDLFFTVASIVDFQRVEGGKVIFDLPYNQVIVPQLCMRFNDISNVGVSGKHFTSFVMIGQHTLANGDGYWKDRCLDLDYQLLTGPMGIPKKELVFKEDVWIGFGAFGYSLEFYARGLELGNAVFTEFEGTPSDYSVMKEKVIDMGAGLERFCWITQGTPTAYDSVFGPVVKNMIDSCGVTYDEEFFQRYSKIAGILNMDEVSDIEQTRKEVAKELGVSTEGLAAKVAPLEAIYAVIDHTKSLMFAISDGALPSNIGGGYNLRVILRRSLGLLNRFSWNIKLEQIADWHIDYLKEMYPDLEEHRDEIATILRVEERRYTAAQARTSKILQDMRKGGKDIGEDDLVTLYDSEGITPDLVRESGVNIDIPTDFYKRVTERHVSQKVDVQKPRFDITGLPKTRTLFYEDQELLDFEATVLRIFSGKQFHVILDKTAFYARAGGQEPDHGTIDGIEVVDVEKYGDIIVHRLGSNGTKLLEGTIVRCRVEGGRRSILTVHHTATHVMLGAAKRVLGSWVWQASAYKDVDKARLDITHYEHLPKARINEIENLANDAIRRNLPVHKLILERNEAEARYGFTIYQGGIVPGRTLRIQDIEGWDVEACAGTHVSRTGALGLIKILKNERVQDGVERLEYVAGETAIAYIQKQDRLLTEAAETIGAQQQKLPDAVSNLKRESDDTRKRHKQLVRRIGSTLIDEMVKSAQDIGGLKVVINDWEEVDEEFHVNMGEMGVRKVPNLIYVGLVNANSRNKLLVFCGDGAQSRGVLAGDLVKVIAKSLGGSGGGNPRFGQGGGKTLATSRSTLDSLNMYLRDVIGN